jgi:5'-nucleotidase
MQGGLDVFHQHEIDNASSHFRLGHFKNFLEAIHNIQSAFPNQKECPIRTALVTARSAPAHKRTILTLRAWGVRLDEAMFMGGKNKTPILKAFGADLFFDDSKNNITLAKDSVSSAHVPYGVRNVEGADERHFTGGGTVETEKKNKLKLK